MQKAEKRLNAILKKSKNSGITTDSLASLDIVKKLCNANKRETYKWITLLLATIISAALYAFFALHSSECFLNFPFDPTKLLRDPENCGICIGVNAIDKVTNISHEDFEEYVSLGRPVVVTDGTRDWTAVDVFDFEFFKKLYKNVEEGLGPKAECQFFPYKTEFKSLVEVFNMTEERSRLEPGTPPWYIGWSNCNDDAGKILRQHYDRPYFIPKTSENIALNWIFMGGPGAGAHMHVDNVVYPSWQAQLKGRKTWRMAPPPECYYKCNEIQVTVEPGEIIVADTNRWYHQTHILPGSISITIGSEFD